METLLKWMPLIVLAVQLLMAWTMWSLSQKFVDRRQYGQDRKESSQRLAELERCAAVEQTRSRYDVTGADLAGIYERINDVDRKVSEQSGELRGIRTNLVVIQQQLMERSRNELFAENHRGPSA